MNTSVPAYQATPAPTLTGAEARGAAITRLTLTSFRSYSRLRLEADRRPVVLTGANGRRQNQPA